MAKGRVIEDKPRKRKISNKSDDSKHFEVSQQNQNSVKPTQQVKMSQIEKSRMRKIHRKHHTKLFDFGKEFPKKIVISIFIALIFAGLFYFGLQRYYLLRKQRQVYTPINLPSIIGQNETGPEISPELFWGSYRPGIYFGMSHRTPHSLLFGLLWTAVDHSSIKLRHQCATEDNLKSYTWIEHDGRNFGLQNIIDGNYNITVSFVKRPVAPYGGDWTARISVSSVRPSDEVRPISFMFYAYLPDSSKGMVKAFADKTELKRLRGFTNELGAFQVNFHTGGKDKRLVLQNTHMMGFCPREDSILPAIASAIVVHPGVFNGFQGMTYMTENQQFSDGFLPPEESNNIWVAECTVKPPGDATSIAVAFEVEFVSQATTSSDAVPLIGKYYELELAKHSHRFHEQFLRQFPRNPRKHSDDQVKLSKLALSNLLGGMGYFYGQSIISSPLLGPEPVLYWPASLFTATPSRQQFPRGFLWDEGFHALLLTQWDVELVLQSLGHWLDLMNAEGWIPREQILGFEAQARVPENFLVQSSAVANPPTLVITIEALLSRLPSMNRDEKDMFNKWITNAFPRLHSWFVWFNTTQSGVLPTSYRWRGRPSNNPHQLNPLTLASGLDDYPRASHPTNDERHLDMRCWMAVFARVMGRLADHINSQHQYTLTGVRSMTDHLGHTYRALSAALNDPELLDELHWSNKHSMYADFGLHTDAINLIRPSRQLGSSINDLPPAKIRIVSEEPQLQYITSAFGYVSLFPLLLRILPPDSPKLEILLDQLGDPNLLFTPYGLRSLATNSPYYQRPNTEHDPSYWRGAIWINMNYLGVQALRYYAKHPKTPSLVALKADQLESRLTDALVKTVLGEFNRTGFLWEQFDDQTGTGQRAHPFSGWTALITLIMSDE